jgi:putative tryptophan/tyrosine transport system substrate-binding protein
MTVMRARRLASALVALRIVAVLGGFAAVQTVIAQSTGNVKRIAYLGTGSRSAGFHESFQKGLRELGWVAGQNIEIEYRFADGKFERLPALAAELVRLNVDIIVASPTAAAQAAKKATSTIPIVMVSVGDPVRLGLVESLARPGGNMTGTAFSVGLESIVKGLELMKVMLPGVRRMAVLSNPANPSQPLAIQDIKAAVQLLGLGVLLLEASGPSEFERVFAAIAKEDADALLVVADSMFIVQRTSLAERALKQRLPSIHGVRENVEAGGLMSYGPSLQQNSRRAAAFVDKILKGAHPAELPVEQPTKFEFVINLKTARALGLTIPPSLLLRADQVIE